MSDYKNWHMINERKKRLQERECRDWWDIPLGVIYYANWYIKRYEKAPQKPSYSLWYKYMLDCRKFHYDVPAYEYLIKNKNWELYQLIDSEVRKTHFPKVGYCYDEQYGNLVPYYVLFPHLK